MQTSPAPMQAPCLDPTLPASEGKTPFLSPSGAGEGYESHLFLAKAMLGPYEGAETVGLWSPEMYRVRCVRVFGD